MPLVQTRDLKIHYQQAGTGERVLILVHGNWGSWRWWRPVLERLPPGYRAYAPDLRGCGDSGRPPRGYTIERLSDDLHAFASALELPRFHLVGHSLGGAAALQFALDHPAQVQTLTLVAPAPAEGLPLFPWGGRKPSWVSRLFKLQREASLGTLDALYRFLRTLGANRPLLRQGLIQAMPALPHDGDEFEALVDDAARVAPQAMVGYIRALDTWDVRAALGGLCLPVLVLSGERDALISQAALARTAGALCQGRWVNWPDVGHAPQLERPQRFVELLTAFVAQNSARASTIITAPTAIPPAPDRPGWLKRAWCLLRRA